MVPWQLSTLVYFSKEIIFLKKKREWVGVRVTSNPSFSMKALKINELFERHMLKLPPY
jgi:hypothetical protein